jgi:glycine/D-amino acid oxidase-like deaminating enzyme
MTMNPDTYDIVAIGGGLGGLAVAAFAETKGLSCLIVEKSSLLGGVGSYSGGFVWAPLTKLATRESGHDDSYSEVDRYLDFVSGGSSSHSASMRQSFVANAAAAVDALSDDLGIAFELTNRPDHYYPTAAGSKSGGRTLEASISGSDLGEWRELLRGCPHWRIGLKQSEIEAAGGKRFAYDRLAGLFKERVAEDYLTMGPGLTGSLLKAAVVDGSAEAWVDATCVALIQEDGRVVGVEVDHAGKRRRILAQKGVVISTGSYGWSEDVALTEGVPGLAEQSPPVTHGDGLQLAGAVGAQIMRRGRAFLTLGFSSNSTLHPGTDVPMHHTIYDAIGFPHSVIVNSQGQRFGDETFYAEFTEQVRRYDSVSKSFPNYPCFLICDDRYRTEYWEHVRGDWPADDFVSASSISELATKLGIDPEGLSAEITRFNAGVDAEIDEWGRGSLAMAQRFFSGSSSSNATLGHISEAPLWAVRLELLGAGIYPIGLRIDEQAQVIGNSGSRIPGLFATGNATAYQEVGYGYEGGLANARNIAYSFAAVSAMSETP